LRANNKNIFFKIKELPLFRGSKPSVNFLLYLLFASYFIVGHDLGKEMAAEKNEIGFFTATLENSISVDNSAVLKILELIPPETGIVQQVTFQIFSSDTELFPPGRSPPAA
jgi:hypothetical protein